MDEHKTIEDIDQVGKWRCVKPRATHAFKGLGKDDILLRDDRAIIMLNMN